MNTATDKAAWDVFITSHEEANFLQAWAFGEFHLRRGKEIVRRVLEKDGRIIAAYTGVVETARRGKYLAIAGGPILDWNDKKTVELVFADMKEQGIAQGCVFVRVRPQLEKSAEGLKLMRSLGLKSAPMYLSVEFAGVLNLEKSEEEILAGASQRLRRALRKAEKAGIEIEKSTDPNALKEFYKIQLETARRHDFVSFSEDFLTKQFTAFAEDGAVALYIAKYEGKILAENFMIFYGNEASYHYGVSSELGTQLSSAPLLHFAAMRDARERGQKRYNFWGIVDEDDTEHRFYGVSTFKRGFGVDELRYTPAHDLILKPALYRLTYLVETARRRRRKV